MVVFSLDDDCLKQNVLSVVKFSNLRITLWYSLWQIWEPYVDHILMGPTGTPPFQ